MQSPLRRLHMKPMSMRHRLAVFVIATALLYPVHQHVAATINQKTRPSSPIPNTTMDSDGVIRLNPQNGCGPFAHVENHPVYGQLCVQNDGSWNVATDGSAVEKSPPCVSTSGSGTASSGLVVSCQPDSAWPSRR